jgi:chromosome segregation ATPase
VISILLPLIIGSTVLIVAQPDSAPADVPSRITSIILGVLVLIGLFFQFVYPNLGKRGSEKRAALKAEKADIRDQQTVDNSIMKDAATTAMELVDRAQAGAQQAVDMVKSSLEIANQTITDLRLTVSDLRDQLRLKEIEIADLRPRAATSDDLRAQLAASEAAREDLAERLVQRQETLHTREAELAQKTTEVNELTLGKDAIQRVRQQLAATE